VSVRLISGEPVFDSGFGGLHVMALIGGLSATAVSNLLGLARRDLQRNGWVIALAPLHWMLLAVAAWRGVFQLLWDPYRWEKTDHGLARSSRLSRRQAATPAAPAIPIQSRGISAGRPPPLRRFA
jgi:hypothetical protein